MFHENLIRLRKAKGLSQEGLGNLVNVARQTVSKWENGETTPEMNKLIELANLFEVSIDELVGNGGSKREAEACRPGRIRLHYEYKSRRSIRGVPLVHINVGYGMRKAKGVIAIGNLAKGVVAVGGLALGVFSFGGLGLGLFTLAGLACGLLFALGGVAVGAVAVGGLAVGLLAVGGAAVGIYAIGGAAIGKDIAFGGYARAHIAIGDMVSGPVQFLTQDGRPAFSAGEVKNAILREFPHTLNIIVSLFTGLVS